MVPNTKYHNKQPMTVNYMTNENTISILKKNRFLNQSDYAMQRTRVLLTHPSFDVIE